MDYRPVWACPGRILRNTKMTGTELEEFYTDDSGAFTVGRALLESSQDLVIEGVDEQGKQCGYFVMPARLVRERRKGTPYLSKIAKYMDYAAAHPYGTWYTPPAFPAAPGEPLLTGVLRHVLESGEVISVGVAEEEFPLTGIVRAFAKGTARIGCIDPETAEPLEEVRVRVREIEYIEYGSIDNRLLQYAFEKA